MREQDCVSVTIIVANIVVFVEVIVAASSVRIRRVYVLFVTYQVKVCT